MIKNIAKLSFSTLASQSIVFFSIPLLSRWLGKEEYSSYVILISILSIFNVVACLKLETALQIVRSANLTAKIFLVSRILPFIIAVFAIIIMTFISYSSDNLKFTGEPKYLVLIAASIISYGFYISNQAMLLRRHNYDDVMKSRMKAAFSGLGVQFLLITIVPSTLMAAVGRILIQSSAFLYAPAQIENKGRDNWGFKAKLLRVYRSQKHILTYGSIEGLVNAASIHLPIIIMSGIIDNEIRASALLATQLSLIPVSLLAANAQQVLLTSFASKSSRRERADFLISFIMKWSAISFSLIVTFCGAIAILSDFVFGTEWKLLDYFILIAIPFITMQVIASPTQVLLHAIGLNREIFIAQIVLFIIRVFPLLVIEFIDVNTYVFELYLLCGFIGYAGILYYVVKSVDKRAVSR